ncbi:MAG: hypothetical protein NZ108_04525 [Bacteroidia bacterium]|nr:hypothetical protein [Bacteroidia bacterium]
MLPEDPKTQELITQAEKFYRAKNFEDAAETYELAAKQKLNTLTTYAMYMSGISYFYANNKTKALEKWIQLLKAYPKTAYAEEANYHKALILLEQNNREAALYLLFNIVEKTNDAVLRGDALNVIKKNLFEADIDFLENYYKIVRKRYKEVVLEALVYKLIKTGKHDRVEELISAITESGQPRPLFLKKYKSWVRNTGYATANQLKIAVLLSLFSNEKEITPKSFMALEFLEGLLVAAQKLKYPHSLNVTIKIWDIEKDNLKTEKLLNSEVTDFKPDIIIGDIYNNPSKIISYYAERNKILHIVPVSPSEELISGKTLTFLANASIPTQLKALAKYAKEELEVKKCLVLNDGSKLSEELCEVFTRYLRNLDVSVSIKKLGEKSNALSSSGWIAKEIDSLNYDGLYFPSNDEEIVGAILSLINKRKVELAVMGTSDWRNFEAIDRDLLEKFQVIFPDFYHEDNDTIQYDLFNRLYNQTWGNYPTRFASQGFDVMRFILLNYPQLISTEDPSIVFHKAKPYRGINQNYYFGKAQDNQSVQLMQFRDKSIEKIKLW